MAQLDELQIVTLDIDDLTPYTRNAKKHPKEQVRLIANSIEQFGMCDPVGIWGENNVIVEGHGRVLALQLLGRKSVPCIRLDHMTDEQRRAYVHAHNKTAESEWDYDVLDEEFAELSDFDFEDFGFEFKYELEDKAAKKNERERTYNSYNMSYFDEQRTEGRWEMPVIKPCDKTPKRMIGFNYAKTSQDYDATIHFYLDDYQFERIWNSPEKYIEILRKFDAVLTPNFSIYYDMAEPLKVYNTYRARLLAQMFQDAGLQVIPIVYWSDERSFEYCFDGLPENSTLSVNTIGNNMKESWDLWHAGVDELIRRKSPKRLLIYGNGTSVDRDFGDIDVIYYKNEVTERMKSEKTL